MWALAKEEKISNRFIKINMRKKSKQKLLKIQIVEPFP